MTTLQLIYQGETLCVTGQYFPDSPPDFVVFGVELGGYDVTDYYRKFKMIPALEDLALEVIAGGCIRNTEKP